MSEDPEQTVEPPPKKITKATPELAYAIREVIEAARFVKKPPIKQIALKHRIAHSYLKKWYNMWTKGYVDLSRGDTTLAEPVQQTIDQKLEMARDLSLIARLGLMLSDQLDEAVFQLKRADYNKKFETFKRLGVDRLINTKKSLITWRFMTEKGYLIVEEAGAKMAAKVAKEEAGRFDAAKEVVAEVVSTTMTEAERFRTVFAGMKPEDTDGKE